MLTVSGPAQTLAALDSVPLVTTSLAGHHDTVRVKLAPVLPEWCVSDPSLAELVIPLQGATPH